jgi:hypothetical protein
MKRVNCEQLGLVGCLSTFTYRPEAILRRAVVQKELQVLFGAKSETKWEQGGLIELKRKSEERRARRSLATLAEHFLKFGNNNQPFPSPRTGTARST